MARMLTTEEQSLWRALVDHYLACLKVEEARRFRIDPRAKGSFILLRPDVRDLLCGRVTEQRLSLPVDARSVRFMSAPAEAGRRDERDRLFCGYPLFSLSKSALIPIFYAEVEVLPGTLERNLDFFRNRTEDSPEELDHAALSDLCEPGEEILDRAYKATGAEYLPLWIRPGSPILSGVGKSGSTAR